MLIKIRYPSIDTITISLFELDELLMSLVLFLPFINMKTTDQCILLARKPREANKVYVKDYLEHLSLKKRIKMLQ